jgi:hypothetical protein
MASTDAGSDNSKQAAEIEGLAQLLHETAEHHGAFEAVAPPHDWWDWYAAYLHTRQADGTSDEAVAVAGRYMAEVKHVVPDQG